ncbi:MAG: hypothetical protein FD174_1835 [Geobacteraceae bacterium]|nr:MAG: hypothetical protein FD174_1835 [Geobacteraceae bacterium]
MTACLAHVKGCPPFAYLPEESSLSGEDRGRQWLCLVELAVPINPIRSKGRPSPACIRGRSMVYEPETGEEDQYAGGGGNPAVMHGAEPGCGCH